MNTPAGTLSSLRYLDEAAMLDSPIHRLNPLSKFLSTIIFLILLVSIGKFGLMQMLPFAFFPIYLVGRSKLSPRHFRPWLVASMPLLLGLGLFNPVLDTRIFLQINSVVITWGWISYLTLILKGALSLYAVYGLVATTGLPSVVRCLSAIGLPEMITLQLLMMGRYLTLLVEEGDNILNAWKFRAPDQKGLPPHIWGPLMGQWLMRTLDRAHRVYHAMLLRGFEGSYPMPALPQWTSRDFYFFVFWLLYLSLARSINLPVMIGNMMMGVF